MRKLFRGFADNDQTKSWKNQKKIRSSDRNNANRKKFI